MRKGDLDSYLRERKVPVNRPGIFKLLYIECSFYRQPRVKIYFGAPRDEESSAGGFFSLLLGKNGVCKSSLLRELIDFIIDARGSYSRRRNKHVAILSVSYIIEATEYVIRNEGNGFFFSRNGVEVNGKSMEYPLIIASTMGMFDRFPLNYTRGIIKHSTRYNPQFYRYVGPKASNNLYTSKANVLLQLLTGLSSLSDKTQLELIGVLLDFIGYDRSLLLRFYRRPSSIDTQSDRFQALSSQQRMVLEKIQSDKETCIDMLFDENHVEHAQSIPWDDIGFLRQNGFISTPQISFSRKG